MDLPISKTSFRNLPQTRQNRYRLIMQELMGFAQLHAIPIGFAPPLIDVLIPIAEGAIASIKLPLTLGKIDGASGCIVRFQSGLFLVTAEHVLACYEERLNNGERLNWQIGKLPPIDPLSRIAWRDKGKDRSLMPHRPTDIVFLKLSDREAIEACGDARGMAAAYFNSWPVTCSSGLSKPVKSGRPQRNDEPRGLRAGVPGYDD